MTTNDATTTTEPFTQMDEYLESNPALKEALRVFSISNQAYEVALRATTARTIVSSDSTTGAVRRANLG